jgi:hypothetical protein
LKVDELTESKRWLTQKIIQNERILKSGAVSVDPSALYPFYEVYGLASFQCFYADWYPTSEMGNVYFSAIDFTLSDLSEERNWADQLAFPTFLDWLIDYLYPSERI